MKVLVIGRRGQLAQSLSEAAWPASFQIDCVGRPSVDLADAPQTEAAVAAAKPDLVVNASAYTAVDRAETEERLAFAVNASGPAAVARVCHRLSVPLLHVSTDYVFDGTRTGPYVEDDPTAPLGVYGRSKREGEQQVAAACPHHLILRTAWLHSPFGTNFVKTMLRLAAIRDEIAVVDDQRGNPTYAPHLAGAIVALATRIAKGSEITWGTYHVTGSGRATWCALAREVFAVSAIRGGPRATVRAITTAEYPTPVRRPANSSLDCSRLQRRFGLELPRWQLGVADCVTRLLAEPPTN